ncbi:MAG: phage holin family protein [Candidatus Pacebacteria bacterium]|nr:phage holin family protein [Candidatus Paceibacterota bacterium]
MNSLIEKLLAGVIGMAASIYLLDGITYDGSFKTILLVGLTVGLLIFFIRPLLSLITLPLRIITLNLFSIVIMMFIIFIVDCIFPPDMFEIFGLQNYFFATLMVWISEKALSMIFK